MSRDILFLCHRVPYPPDKGDRIRSYHILKLLASMGDVTVGYLSDGMESSQTERWLEQNCKHVVCEPVGRYKRWMHAAAMMLRGRSATEGLFYSARFRRRIDRLLEEVDFDAVVCFSSSVVQYVAGRGLESRTIVDLVDVDSQKWLDYAERAPRPVSWLFGWEASRVRRIETDVSRAKAVVVCTKPEAEIYRGFCPAENSAVIANGVDFEYFAPANSDLRSDCVFIGYLDYRANVTGLQWFCEHVWPRLRASNPHAIFQIVGRNAVPAVVDLGDIPGVEVVGAVDDIRPYLHGALIVIAPLLVARGVQNKVLEAMAAAKPVVGTPQALTGIDVRHGEHVFSAESPDEWVATMTALWSEPRRAREIGESARRFVEANHRWDTCLKPFVDLLDARPKSSSFVPMQSEAPVRESAASLP
jgi:sugar transferase (PEP-CTERM/EpsH1 system associated)